MLNAALTSVHNRSRHGDEEKRATTVSAPASTRAEPPRNAAPRRDAKAKIVFVRIVGASGETAARAGA